MNPADKHKPVIGLAGGIGSGKSLVAGQLRALACAVIDADELAFIFSPRKESIGLIAADLALNDATREFQQSYIQQTIQRTLGNVSEAAKLLGVHRSNLYRKMRQLGMETGDEA